VKRDNKYEDILQDCLVRVLEREEPLQRVLSEYPLWAGNLLGEIETAQQVIRLQKHFDPRPGFLDTAHCTMINQIRLSVRRDLWSPSSRFKLFPRVAILILILFAFLMGGVTAALAAQDALPGNVLFPVRGVVESLQLLPLVDDSREVKVHMNLAQAYLVDYAVLVSQGSWEDATLVLQRYDRHISRTGRILHDLSKTDDEDFNALNQIFIRIFLQDLEIFQVLSFSDF